MPVIPYSAVTFNEVPSLAASDRNFQLRHGEAFVMSSLRLLTFSHNLQDVFGVRLLYQQSDLSPEEKLVDLNGQVTIWDFGTRDRSRDGNIHPTSWLVVRCRGLMPYEFKSSRGGIDLSHPRYQPFLKELVIAVEATGLECSVALTLRQERHLELGSTSGRGYSLVSGGTMGIYTGKANTQSTDSPQSGPQGLRLFWYFDRR